MFGPPCHKCGSEFGWLPGKDGEKCECGWPDKDDDEEEEIVPYTAKPFGDSELGQGLGCMAILIGIAVVILALKFTFHG